MKGIILAGGSGTRLSPSTKIISKQLLPIFDKPMIYYSLSVLMLANIKDILIITSPEDNQNFKRLLGNGIDFGINISYAVQKRPEGLAQAFIIGESFINKSKCALILGDNFFYGNNFKFHLNSPKRKKTGARIFAYPVSDPQRYGIVEFNDLGKAISVIEKPIKPVSNLAITGLYYFDERVSEFAKTVKPSNRGELEITSIINIYLDLNQLETEVLGRGIAWLDTGTHESLLEASQFVHTIEKRQGLKICCPEEIALRNKWIDKDQFKQLAKMHGSSSYGEYLLKLINNGMK